MYKLFCVLIIAFYFSTTNFSLGQNECMQRILKEASTIDTLSYSSGTGFFINNEGYIVTNKHVVGNYLELNVKFNYNGKEIQKKAELVGYLMDEDIAIIKVDVKGLILPVVPYGFSKNDLNIGNKIYTLGFPKPGVLGESIKLTEGIVNSTSGFQDNASEYQISAQIQAGNSGSPMFDSKGNVKGVVYASYEAGQNVNYAIKSSKLIELLNLLKIKFNSVEVNTPFVQNVSKYQWSICLISVVESKKYYTEFSNGEGKLPQINPNYVIDKSRCDNSEMFRMLESYDENMSWENVDEGLNNIEATLLWSYMASTPISFEIAQKNYYLLQIGAYENIIENHDKSNIISTTRIFEDGPFSIDWYLSEFGDFQFYFDSKIRMYGSGINFDISELNMLDSYILNLQSQIENFSLNQFKTKEYLDEVKLLRAPLYIYRAYISFVIASELNSDDYSKICCDFIKKAKYINNAVEIWFPAENCN